MTFLAAPSLLAPFSINAAKSLQIGLYPSVGVGDSSHHFRVGTHLWNFVQTSGTFQMAGLVQSALSFLPKIGGLPNFVDRVVVFSQSSST